MNLSNQATELDADELTRLLRDLVAQQSRAIPIHKIEILKDTDPLPDATTKIIARDPRGKPSGFVLMSSPVAPGMVRRGTDRARTVADALPENLAHVIIRPLAEAEYRGCTFALFPFRTPVATGRLRRKWQQRRLGHALLDWKAAVSARTANPCSQPNSRTAFRTALHAASTYDGLPPTLKQAAQHALERMEHDAWLPCSTMAHNDFWWSNVVLSPPDESADHGFQVVDWASARLDGFGVYDLLRMLGSLGLPTSKGQYWIKREAEALRCDVKDLEAHLAASLGDLSMHLEHFPRHRFVTMAGKLADQLQRLI